MAIAPAPFNPAAPPTGPVPMRLKFPLGADNRSREYELPEGTARRIENLDVTRGGGLLCRKGARRVLTGTCHSLAWNPVGGYGLVVRESVLTRLDRALTPTALVAVGPGRVSYAELNGAMYWSNGTEQGMVTSEGTVGRWGLPTPPPLVATAAAVGGLTAGSYQLTPTAVVAGLESGAPETVTVTVAEGGGLTITTPAASAGVTFRIYRTGPQGESNALRAVGDFPPATTVTLGTGFRGQRLESLLAVPPPPGTELLAHQGRLWIAAGRTLWFTSELSPHWLFPAENYLWFESSITMLGSVDDGLYVGMAARTVFLQGKSPNELTRRVVDAVGALPGSGAAGATDLFLDNSGPGRVALWVDTDGYVTVGKAGGLVLKPHKPRYTLGPGSRGQVTTRARDGLIQLLALADRGGSGNVATEVPIATAHRQGIVLGQFHLDAIPLSATGTAISTVTP